MRFVCWFRFLYVSDICLYMTLYKKLVRDKIPDIIIRGGRRIRMRQAADDEMAGFLKQKFYEEAEEFFSSGKKEELADVLQVLYAMSEFYNFGISELEEIRKRKLEERGDFSKRIILESVDDA